MMNCGGELSRFWSRFHNGVDTRVETEPDLTPKQLFFSRSPPGGKNFFIAKIFVPRDSATPKPFPV